MVFVGFDCLSLFFHVILEQCGHRAELAQFLSQSKDIK